MYNFIESHNKVQSSSHPIITYTFTPGEKEINGGVELSHTQWIISKPKNKTIARHNISNR